MLEDFSCRKRFIRCFILFDVGIIRTVFLLIPENKNKLKNLLRFSVSIFERLLVVKV